VTYKVLIVDDSKLARMALARALSTLHPDWRRFEAGSADEALKQIDEELPDIVLLDFNMPGKDGLVFAAELRQRDSRISVAVISANRQAEVIDRARASGAAFLAKPVTDEALGECLHKFVEKRPVASS
jgi:CheY-like chemotaxis protein